MNQFIETYKQPHKTSLPKKKTTQNLHVFILYADVPSKNNPLLRLLRWEHAHTISTNFFQRMQLLSVSKINHFFFYSFEHGHTLLYMYLDEIMFTNIQG